MSGNAQTQLAVSQVSTISSLYYTSTLGQSWAVLSGASGLPTATQTNYSAGAVSGTGQYQILGTSGGHSYVSNNYGASFTNANPYIPYIYMPFETAPVSGAIINTTLTVIGSPALVTGIVGSKAVNLANTAGGTPTQYIRGTISLMPSCTISLWINVSSFYSYQNIFGMYNGIFNLFINGVNNKLALAVPTGVGTASTVLTELTISLNTWYSVYIIFQTGGLCSFYVNNNLIGTYSNTGTASFTSSGFFALGTLDNNTVNAFNGYIDDLKIYNTAIPFTPMGPSTYSTTSISNIVAVSNNGTYMLSATELGLFMSSNSGSTWSQVTSELLQANWSSLAISATGQYMLAYSDPVVVSPYLSGLASYTWTVNNVSWTTSSSSTYNGSTLPYIAFNGNYALAWAGAASTYSSSAPYGYIGIYSTTIIGIGATGGDWLQIQSSVPIQMSSYIIASCGVPQTPKTYYIVGSNDGINWYPIINVQGVTNPYSANNTEFSPYLVISTSTGAQTQNVNGGTAGSFTTYGYATSLNSYTYFRIVITQNWGYVNGNTNIGGWLIRFNAGGQAYSTNFGSTWQNGYALATPSLSLSGSGQYAIGANAVVSQYTIVNNYLSGFGTGTATTGTVTGTIVASAVSTTGQYMAIVTTNTSSPNVYYSSNYGANFTGLTVGSTAMTTCAISADGSYITVSNGTTVYQLNNNSNGFSLALGNKAGQQNQGQNAIAIGNFAGQINQSANSIILNATGSALTSCGQGFYVTPIAQYTTSPSATFGLLAYGTDNQIVQSGIIISSQTSTQTLMQVTGTITTSSIAAATDLIAQGIYLTPSPANSATILQYIQKVVNTITPTAGTPPFWMNSYVYGTTGTTPGSGAYVGGVLMPNGNVLLVPLNATSIGIYNPTTNTFSTTGTTPGSAAYQGGVLLPDGRIVFVPFDATSIGIYNPTTNTFSTTGTTPGNGAYYGGVLLPNGNVLFVPFGATSIGIYNPTTNVFSTTGTTPGSAAYIGGVLMPNGNVLFVPLSPTSIGIYNPTTNTFSTTGTTPGSAAYVGGVLMSNGNVLLVPYSAASIGIYNPTTNTFSTTGITPSSNAYVGGVFLPNGNVLFIPSYATSIGIYNPTTNTFSTTGTTPGNGAYSGGVLLPDGRVVFVPTNATTIGIVSTGLTAPREMCLSPYFNKF
jgi:hypothetical protein